MRMILIGFASVVLIVQPGCKTEPTGFPLNIATVQKIDSGSIEFEEQRGKIIVMLVDKFHDCHVHILSHDGMTKESALTILKTKQQELKNKEPEQSSGGDSLKAAPQK